MTEKNKEHRELVRQFKGIVSLRKRPSKKERRELAEKFSREKRNIFQEYRLE